MELPERTELTYSDGQALDVFGDTGPVILPWHGSGANERDGLRPLAQELARAEVIVVVPDWNPAASDGGRSHLAASMRFAFTVAEKGGDSAITVAGWSLGATAAAALAYGSPGKVLIRSIVGISGGYSERRPFIPATS